MKALWNSCKAAFSMFSRIPMPRTEWSGENQRYLFCFFPWIGLVIGALEIVFFRISRLLDLNSIFTGMVLTMIPVLVTGGIHLDGLMDTSDAISAWADREKRLSIMKDSHAGGFAVIACCCWFAVMIGSCSQFSGELDSVCLFALSFVESRCLSAIGVLTIPGANPKGTAASFADQAERKKVLTVLAVYLCFILAGYLLTSLGKGAAVFCLQFFVFFLYRKMALRYFGGTTGDVAGFFLCVCEGASAFLLALLPFC